MGWFKKLTGVSSKSLTGKAISAVGAAVGAGLGGPEGAALGFNAGNSLAGMFGLSDDNLQAQYNLAMQKDLAKYNATQQGQLNNQAFEQNLQMWNLKNAYDSPAEQMKRYEAAGLNPNLIYGQSNLSGGAPQFEAPRFDTGQYQPVDTRIQKAQLLLALEAQHQQIRNQQIENEFTREKIKLAARDADRSDKLAAAQINALAQGYALTDARISDINYKHDQPKSWIGRNYSDIKDIASGFGDYAANIYSDFKTYVKNKFHEKYPKLSNFHWY